MFKSIKCGNSYPALSRLQETTCKLVWGSGHWHAVLLSPLDRVAGENEGQGTAAPCVFILKGKESSPLAICFKKNIHLLSCESNFRFRQRIWFQIKILVFLWGKSDTGLKLFENGPSGGGINTPEGESSLLRRGWTLWRANQYSGDTPEGWSTLRRVWTIRRVTQQGRRGIDTPKGMIYTREGRSTLRRKNRP